jgi:hypothetical protein
MTKVLSPSLSAKWYTKHNLSNTSGAQVLTITPTIARFILDNLNNTNRPLNQSIANEYARRMVLGEWIMNGESLKFSTEGLLIDGQHRLMGVIIAKINIDLMSVFGLPPNAFQTIDDGKKRSPGDVLHIHGVENANSTAAAIKFIIRYKKGVSNRSVNANGKISNQDVLNWYKKHPSISDDIRFSYTLYDASGRIILTPSKICAYYFLFSEIDKNDAGKFLSRLAIGSELKRKDPIFLLRSKLVEAKINKQVSLSGVVEQALIIKAWNKWRSKSSISILKWDAHREPFPKIK